MTTTRPRPFSPTRRGLCLCCALATAHAASSGWLSPREASAQAQGIVDGIRAAAATATITVHRLRGGVSVLEGSGGNIGVLAGPDGKLLVDAGITASRPRIAEALDGLGREPIRHLVNTHWHFDHADGNEWLNAAGATITAHENARRRLSVAQRVEDWNFDFPPAPRGAIPSRVVETEDVLRLNGSTVALRHHGPAHTDGDIAVTFGEAGIVHAGDLYWTAGYPFVDYSTGGSIDGTIRAAEAVLASATDGMIIVPGHGHPVSDRAGLVEYRAMLVDVREAVARLKRQGRSLDETIAARPTAAHDARWGGFVVGPALFTKLAYAGV